MTRYTPHYDLVLNAVFLPNVEFKVRHDDMAMLTIISAEEKNSNIYVQRALPLIAAHSFSPHELSATVRHAQEDLIKILCEHSKSKQYMHRAMFDTYNKINRGSDHMFMYAGTEYGPYRTDEDAYIAFKLLTYRGQ